MNRPARAPLLLLAALILVPTLFRAALARPRPPGPCRPVARGVPPRGWVGCGADASDRRLSGAERLAFGLPVPLASATAEDLAGVPGIGPKLARAVVEDRERRGPFPTVDSLDRVRGIGPARTERARAFLTVE